jgi:hypothetical protein
MLPHDFRVAAVQLAERILQGAPEADWERTMPPLFRALQHLPNDFQVRETRALQDFCYMYGQWVQWAENPDNADWAPKYRRYIRQFASRLVSRWGNTAQTYEEAFPALRHVWIEESDVLEILPSKHLLEFELDVALMTTHPDYLGPAQGEHFDIDIRRRWLLMESSAIEFEPSNIRPERDANGAQDFGLIDTFLHAGGNSWLLEGEWGQAAVVDPVVTLTMSPRRA